MTEPVLTHSYYGHGMRMVTGSDGTPELPRTAELELIRGSFRVVSRTVLAARIGNGESPETFWLIGDPDNLIPVAS